MIINFLQARSPHKILPTLQQKPHERRADTQGNVPAFDDDLDSFRGFGSPNKESIADLLFGFFRRYGHEIDYEKNVISVREGSLIAKESKGWHQLQNNRLCVEEPFNTGRNLANTADDTSVRGIHLELRRAFDLICEGKLDECCEQYIVPEVEETPNPNIFVRPTPQPLPTLSRSHSQSRRSSKSSGSNGHVNGAGKAGSAGSKSRAISASGRRASSAAASQKQMLYPSPVLNGYPVQNDGAHLHEQLNHHYQLLQAQEAQLRLQMFQKAQLTASGKSSAPSPRAPRGNAEGPRRNSNIEAPPFSAPLRSVQQNYYYPAAATQHRNVAPSPSSAISQNTTNPPSPLILSDRPLATDTRQGLHRSVLTANPNGPMRSRSQPPLPAEFMLGPRPVHMPAAAPHQAGFVQNGLVGFASLKDYQDAWAQQNAERVAAGLNASESPAVMPLQGDAFYEDRFSQEHMGYYVDHNYRAHPIRRDLFSQSPRLAPWRDSSGRPNGLSPGMQRVRADTTSRSPSPSLLAGPSRDRSISFYSSTHGLQIPQPSRSNASSQPSRTESTTPVIVDGSGDTPDDPRPPEGLFFPTPASDAASLSDDVPVYTPSTATGATPSVESLDTSTPDVTAEARMTNSVPNMLQFGDFPARVAVRCAPSPSRDHAQAPAERSAVPSEQRVNGVTDSAPGLGIEFGGKKSMEPATHTQASLSTTGSAASSTLPTPAVAGLNLASSVKPPPLLSPVREVRTPSPTLARAAAAVALPIVGDRASKSSHSKSSSLSGKEKLSSPLAEKAVSSMESAAPKRIDKGKDVVQSNGVANGVVPSPVRTAPKAPKRPPQSPNTPSPRPGSTSQPPKASSPIVAQQPVKQEAAPPQVSGWQQTTSKKNRHRKRASLNGSGSGMAIPSNEEERKGG